MRKIVGELLYCMLVGAFIVGMVTIAAIVNFPDFLPQANWKKKRQEAG